MTIAEATSPGPLSEFSLAVNGRLGADGQGTGTCPTCEKKDKFRYCVGGGGLVVFSCHSGECGSRADDAEWLRSTAERLVALGVPENGLQALAHSTRRAGVSAAMPARSAAYPATAPNLPSPEAVDRALHRLLNSADLLRSLQERTGLTTEDVARAGIGYDARERRYWLPVYGDDELLTIIRRDFGLALAGGRAKSLIWKGSQGSFLYAPFGVREDAPVIIAAGERDCLALCARGLNAVCFTNGESATPPISRLQPLLGKDVVFAYDNDAGNHAPKVASGLLPHVTSVRIVDWPSEVPFGHDVCDILNDTELGLDAIEKAVANARPWGPADSTAAEEAAELAAALKRLRIRDQATAVLRTEKADAAFRIPPSDKTLTDMLAKDRPPQRFTIDRLHPSGSNSLIAAQYKVGKTTLMMNLLQAYADSKPFLGEFKVTPGDGRIALFNYELTEDMLLDGYLVPLGIENSDAVVVLNLRGWNFDLRSPAAFAWAARWLRERNCDALIVDPFGAAARLQNENDNSEARNWLLGVLDPFKEEAGIRDLWMPAHTGRGLAEEGQEHVRGASAVDDWADVRWLYAKAKVSDENGGSWRRFLSASGRGVDVPERELAYEPEDHWLYVSQYRSRSEARATEGVAAVAHVVETKPGINASDLKGALHIGNRDKSTAINQAVHQGLVHVRPGARNAKHYFPGPEGVDG